MARLLARLCALIAVAAGSIAAAAAPAAAQGSAPYPDTLPDAYYALPVSALAGDGMFAGTECADGFCPDEPIDRATMAVWTVRVLDLKDPSPPASSRFTDVDTSHPHAAFIERFAQLGVTQGCGDDTRFCPDDPVTRAHMAVFLSRAYRLAEGPDPGFSDVASDAWYASEVAELAASGITAGCGDGTRFCPEEPTTRAQMATLLFRAEHRSKRPCKPPGQGHLTAGFPLPAGAAPSSGRVAMAVLFMDFPDARATYTTQEEIDPGLGYMERYLEASSYGRLELEIDVVHRWLRTENSYTTYVAADAAGASGLRPDAGAESVRLADDIYDFSETDIVLTVFPSAHFGRGLALGHASADGQDLSTFRINTHPTSEGSPWNWGLVAAHELTHNFGLVDYYPYDYSRHEGPDWPAISFRIGLMSLWVQSPVAGRHEESAALNSGMTLTEMLSWSRWQLGWLDPWQVKCSAEEATTTVLHPVAQPGPGPAMVAVPLNEHELVVIENRRAVGYDATVRPVVTPGGGPSGRDRFTEDSASELGIEGVLVYTVDARIGTGDLPVRIAGDSGNGIISEFPLLTVGESVEVRGYTITVTADDGYSYEVAITRSG